LRARVEGLDDQVDQARQLMVERQPLGDRIGDLDEYRETADRVTCRRRRHRLAAE